MSRKHFEAVAAALAANMAAADSQREQLRVVAVASDLASVFAQVNPRFDRRRFMLAAGVDAALV